MQYINTLEYSTLTMHNCQHHITIQYVLYCQQFCYNELPQNQNKKCDSELLYQQHQSYGINSSDSVWSEWLSAHKQTLPTYSCSYNNKLVTALQHTNETNHSQSSTITVLISWTPGRTVFILLIGFVLVFSSRLSSVD